MTCGSLVREVQIHSDTSNGIQKSIKKWDLSKAVFDSRKKRCTCKFKIFELSKRNQKGAQRSSRLRNKFSTANQIAGKKLLFLLNLNLRCYTASKNR